MDAELNETVAKKLGWEADLPASSPVGDPDGALWIKGRDTSKHYRLPDFCHSIQAAWEIVNQFHEVTLGTILTDGPCWFCEIRPQVGEPVKVIADTAPLAICQAFLKLP